MLNKSTSTIRNSYLISDIRTTPLPDALVRAALESADPVVMRHDLEMILTIMEEAPGDPKSHAPPGRLSIPAGGSSVSAAQPLHRELDLAAGKLAPGLNFGHIRSRRPAIQKRP